MKSIILLMLFICKSAFAGGDNVGNGGDSIALNFKTIGNTLVLQLRAANSVEALEIDPEKFKEKLETANIESTTKQLYLRGMRKDAINYPKENRIIIYETGWRMLSIQDKRMLVLHELLGLMGIDDSTYRITLALEKTAAIETVPYFAGKDEECLDSNHKPVPGEVFNVQLVQILIISDIYSASDRENYCTVMTKTKDQSIRRFSASFSINCKKLFEEKKDQVKLRVVGDHICKIL